MSGCVQLQNENGAMWLPRLAKYICMLGILAFAATACAQSAKDVDPMTQKEIQELSGLSGAQYVERRNAFLKSASSLPEYSEPLSTHDVRYRMQYLILRGWQKNSALYAEIEKDLDAVDEDTQSASAAGFFPITNKSAKRSAEEWREDGLPYAWEDILKFVAVKPKWRINNSLAIIQGYPHEDSVDALLISMHLNENRSAYAHRFKVLRKMPKDALEDRLDEIGNFYTFVRPILKSALGKK